ncbi:hypothetical protein predicted by Glimmer/Critica [Helicobacter pylori B8]|uniref:Uncharacterized protein n=1 Tax=Helicobacter pylori (strain B8) TaxID=693745 RepID=D7FEC6_HELP3|nr:hypothetical protein predicted by Glimmer/Critica [Helicobacter pylori B8]
MNNKEVFMEKILAFFIPSFFISGFFLGGGGYL